MFQTHAHEVCVETERLLTITPESCFHVLGVPISVRHSPKQMLLVVFRCGFSYMDVVFKSHILSCKWMDGPCGPSRTLPDDKMCHLNVFITWSIKSTGMWEV